MVDSCVRLSHAGMLVARPPAWFFAALLVPFIHLSVYLFRSQHPMPVVLKPEAPSMPAEMTTTLLIGFAAFALLFAALLRARYRLAVRRDLVLAAEEGLPS